MQNFQIYLSISLKKRILLSDAVRWSKIYGFSPLAFHWHCAFIPVEAFSLRLVTYSLFQSLNHL